MKYTYTSVFVFNSSAIFFFYNLLFLPDEDSNGAIDQEEMKKCFQKLGISFTEEEISDLFNACDINEDMGIKFNEFIVLLCLVYLLKDDQTSLHTVSKIHFLFMSQYLICPACFGYVICLEDNNESFFLFSFKFI